MMDFNRVGLLTHVYSTDIDFTQLNYHVPAPRSKGKKAILKNIEGHFHSGKLTAILGPSGAGKSTLLNVIAGYKTSSCTSGQLLVNGEARDMKSFRKSLCYIMQDVEFFPYLTVAETMHVAATLKLGKGTSHKQRDDSIEAILQALGLEGCRDTMVCKMSGGERKRLSIAEELLSNPSVMLFDEPTSGLDSVACYKCLLPLKLLAEGGRTVICTLHQPSARVLETFDHLYVMAAGQCIYEGGISDLVPFLSAQGLQCPTYHNVADYVMEVACSSAVEQLVQAVGSTKYRQTWSSKSDGAASSSQIHTTDQQSSPQDKMILKYSPASTATQIAVLMKRSILCGFRDPALNHFRLLTHVVVGITLGVLYYQSGNEASLVFYNLNLLLVTVMCVMFTGLFSTVLSYPLERSIITREHLNYSYSVKSYFLAKCLADIPLQMFYSVIFVLIVHCLSGQPTDAYRICLALIIGTLMSFLSQSLGFAIGTAANFQIAIVLTVTFCLPQTVFCGGPLIYFNAMPSYLKWVSYGDFIRYAFEGYVLTVYGFGRKKLDCVEIYCHFKNPTKLLQELEMTDSNLVFDIVGLLIYIIVLRVLAYVVLKFRLRRD